MSGIKFERHFCVTTYVYDEESDRFLMIRHRKLNKWLPPGGHVDENELPEDAAVRECLEETGVPVELIGERAPVEGGMVRPFGAQLNVIHPGQHEHMDLIYLAHPSGPKDLRFNEQETDGAQWVGTDQILMPDFDTFDSVRYWVGRFSHRLVAR